MPVIGTCQAQKKAPPKRGQFAHREVDSGLSMLANNCSRQGLCASVQKCTAPDPDLCRNVGKPDPEPEVVCIFAQPRPRGRGFWAHYSPLVPILGFVGVIRESDWVVWLVFGCDIDHTALCFFHDFAQFCEDLVFGHGFDVFVCDV